ncbi:MAG: hypothetical protein KA248_14580 [Kiritimatiellae bacterium]|nr:hypothetical protein [Kiritimatiellia bacterium]
MKRILGGLLLVLCAVAASAMVKINGMDYVTITNAVAHASSGDTILISTGVYNEAVDIFGKDLTLDGGYNHDCSLKVVGGQSVVDGSLLAGGSVMTITGSVVNLVNLDLRGGHVFLLPMVYRGGGLKILSSSSVTATACRVYSNEVYGMGGGIYVTNSSLSLLDTDVFSNRAERTHALATPPNAFGWGGGICVENGLLNLDGDSVIWDNWAFNEGGGICAQESWTLIRDTDADVLRNSASNGAGLAVNGGFLEVSSGADVAGNTAEGRGGGLLLRGGATGILHGSQTSVGVLEKNQVTNGMGGGICVLDSTLIMSNRSRVAFNSATEAGGGIYLSNSVCLLDGAYIGWNGYTNSALSGGGMAAVASTVTLAGASYVRGGRALGGGGIAADRCTLYVGSDAVIGEADPLNANQAWVGGGIYAGDSRIEVNGGVWNNLAFFGDGGGLALEDCELVAGSARFYGNRTVGRGGGISMVGGTGTCFGVQIVSNAAAYGGGAAFVNTAGFAIYGASLVASNSATVNGGGIYHSSTGTTSVRDSVLQNNSAAGYGGAMCVVSGAVDVRNGEMIANSAGAAGGAAYVTNAALSVFATPAGATIYDNQAEQGGGIAAHGGAFANLTGEGDLLLTGNRARGDGGGLWLSQAAAFGQGRIYVGGNTASNCGGGMLVEDNSSILMFPRPVGGGYIYNNRAGISGGGLCLSNDARAELTDVRIGYTDPFSSSPNYARGTNSFQGGGGVAVLGGSRLYGTNIWVGYNVSSNAGGGIYVNGSMLSVRGDLYRTPADGLLPPNRFEYNRAASGNGGGVCGIMSVFELWDALVFSNRAQRGGGIQVDARATGTFYNVVIADNTASITGGGVRVFSADSEAELVHCNLAYNWGDGLSGDPAAWVQLTYSIVWGNSGLPLTLGHIVNYCDVEGGYPGTGNFSAPPLFKGWPQGDYRLLFGSPCIDQGLSGVLWLYDCIGEPRPFGAWPDLGAYEYNSDWYDSDDDIIPDGWEDDHGLDPLVADALLNSDPDEYLNIEEYISDTDPLDGSSHLYITSITNGATRDVSFLSSTARVYALYATPYMTNDATWVVVGTNANLRGNGATYTAMDTNAPAAGAFYRVDVRLP